MRSLLVTLFPPQASNLAPRVDALYFALLGLCGLVALCVFFAIGYFCIRYRRGTRPHRIPSEWPRSPLEMSWTLIPFFIFLAIFVWAAEVFFGMSRAPAEAVEIYIVGKQWMWKIQHPDGRREIDELHLLVGQPVRLIMTSQDVIHDFYVPAFRNKQDVVPGRYTTEWFTPTRVGTYPFFCAEYCGTGHSRMIGTIHVMEPAAHAQWLARQPAPDSLSAIGERAFRARGCSGCHAPQAAVRAPLLQGLFGRQVPLADGSLVTADEQYLRDSILLPNKAITAGYEAIMPTYQGQISEEEVAAIVAYLKSLREEERP